MFRAASLAALSLLAAVFAACGGGAASGEADPASAAPAGAMAYIEIAVRPDGETRDNALDAVGKVLNTDDPEGKIREVIDKAMAEQDADTAGLDYDKDIKPWLGERAGAWFNSTVDDDGDPGGAVLVGVTDAEAAMDAVHKGYSNSGEKLVKRSYNGVDYEVDEDGTAIGIVGDDFLAAGPEATFKTTIDAQKGVLARRVRPVQEGAREPGREPPRALLCRSQAGVRARRLAARRDRTAAAAQAVPEGHPVRQDRRADGLVRGGRRPPGARHGRQPRGRRLARRARQALLDGQHAAAQGTAGRHVGGVRIAQVRPVDQGGARPVRRPARRHGRPRAAARASSASTSTRTS